MNTSRRLAIAALTVAGLLWGTTVPLSKVALTWLPPGWLTFARFAAAAVVLILACGQTAVGRARLRAALTPGVLATGAIGYGGSVLVQNAGITRTSVSSAALLIGATPVLVALIAAGWHRAVARPVAWLGFAVSLAGVGLVAGGGGGGSSVAGDVLVLASLLLSAGATVAQGRLLAGRDPVAVTSVQFLAAALAVLPVAVLTEPAPGVPGGAAAGALLATAGLVVGGTVLPFTLFAYGQARIPAEVAGAFLNIEPLVGAVAGVIVFGNPAGPQQLLGGAAILAGIALSSLPLLAAARAEGAAGAGPAETPIAREEQAGAPMAEARPAGGPVLAGPAAGQAPVPVLPARPGSELLPPGCGAVRPDRGPRRAAGPASSVTTSGLASARAASGPAVPTPRAATGPASGRPGGRPGGDEESAATPARICGWPRPGRAARWMAASCSWSAAGRPGLEARVADAARPEDFADAWPAAFCCSAGSSATSAPPTSSARCEQPRPCVPMARPSSGPGTAGHRT